MGNIEYKFGEEVCDADIDQIRVLSKSLIQSFFGDPQVEDFGGRGEDDEEVRVWIEERTKQIMDLIENPDAVVAMDDGKIVGVGGVKNHGKTKDGRAILQIANASVDPKYRGKKIGIGMYKEGMKRVEGKYPNAVLLGFSRNKIIQDAALARGYKVISYEEYIKLTGYDFSDETIDELKRDGYVALKKDPLGSVNRVVQATSGVKLIGRLVGRKLRKVLRPH